MSHLLNKEDAMRRARITSENGGFYHVISRIIERRRILGDPEKEVFRSIMRQVAGFCGVKVLTWSAMSSHWHILLYVPARGPVSDEIFVELDSKGQASFCTLNQFYKCLMHDPVLRLYNIT